MLALFAREQALELASDSWVTAGFGDSVAGLGDSLIDHSPRPDQLILVPRRRTPRSLNYLRRTGRQGAIGNRNGTALPLRVTERIDYASKSVLLLSQHEGDFLRAKGVADHYGMSVKLLGGVMWCLATAGIVDSRRG